MADARQIILDVMQEVQGIAKRDRNTQQNFNFRGIDAVINAVGPALRKAGGFIVPTVMKMEHSVAQTSKGNQVNVVHLKVCYSIVGSEGEPITGTVFAEAMDSGDKATAKAMSVALRTFLLQVLALPTDEPDPDSFSYEATKVTPKPARDWNKEAEALAIVYNIDGLRALYSEAQASQASAEVLEQIKGWANVASNT